MADIINPYANPYLPAFAANRPRIENQSAVQKPSMSVGGLVYKQIQPVNGFEGADAYAQTLAAGSSDICSESDPSIPRVYIVAKDANGQCFVQGCDMTLVDRPKPVTMDDLNAKMSELIDRVKKLECEKERGIIYDGKSGNGYVPKNTKQSNDTRIQTNNRNAQSSQKPTSGTSTIGSEQSQYAACD